MGKTKTTVVNFHDARLIVIITCDNRHWVSMRSVCDGIGISWYGQQERLNKNHVLKSTVCIMKSVAKDGKIRGQIFIPVEHLNDWLSGIDHKHVGAEIRPMLIRYQHECFSAIENFLNDKRGTMPLSVKTGRDSLKAWRESVEIMLSEVGMKCPDFPGVTDEMRDAIAREYLAGERWILAFDHTAKPDLQRIQRDAVMLSLSNLQQVLDVISNSLPYNMLPDVLRVVTDRVEKARI